MPSCGARMSMRLSWSSAATLRSTSSAILPRISRELLADLGAQILVDLQDLQLGLGDLALGLGDRGDERAALALEARGVALERGHALDLDEVLAPEVAHALELLRDQLDLALLRGDLVGRGPLICSLSCADALPELRLLAVPGRAAESRTGLARPSIDAGDLRVRRRAPGARAGKSPPRRRRARPRAAPGAPAARSGSSPRWRGWPG